jgi:glycosyltransferase involved in cell wall biosynthesis
MIGGLKRYTLFRHEYFHQRFAKRRVHARLPKSTTVVFVSDWMRERVMKTELARFRVERIHNGVDLDAFRRHPNAREELGLPATAPVITFVAHHNHWTSDERKGGHILARALAEIVIPHFPNLVVLAVGGGMIPNLPNVRPIGYVSPENVTRYYSAADIFVAPSLADNLPYTVLEAMACEVPVVASRVGGIPEEVEDYKTGRLFSTGSWQGLGQCLVELLERPTLTAEMGCAARRRVEDFFSLTAFVQQYESLFESLETIAAV